MELVETAKQDCADPVVLIEQRLDFSKYVDVITSYSIHYTKLYEIPGCLFTHAVLTLYMRMNSALRRS